MEKHSSLLTASQVPLVCPGHTRPVVQLEYSKKTDDGVFLVSACKDGKPMLRNGDTGDWIGTFLGHKGAVWSCRLDSTSNQAVTGSADFTAMVWNAITGDCLHTFKHEHVVVATGFSPDSTRVATGGYEKVLRIFDLNAPDSDPVELKGSEGRIRSIQWLTDKLVVSAAEDKQIKVWDLSSNSVIKEIPCSGEISDVELSWDRKIITVATNDSVSFIDTDKFEVVKSFNHAAGVRSASLHPDGCRYIVGRSISDNWVHSYDFETGTEEEVHKGHHGPVHSVRYASSGLSYASGSEDGTIRLWKDRKSLEQEKGS